MIQRLLRPHEAMTSPLAGRSPATLWIAAWSAGLVVVHTLLSAASASHGALDLFDRSVGSWAVVNLATALTVAVVCALGSHIYTGRAIGATVAIGPVSLAWYGVAGVLGGLARCMAEQSVGVELDLPARMDRIMDVALVTGLTVLLGVAANVLGNLGEHSAETNLALRERMVELERTLLDLRQSQDLAADAEEHVRKQMADMLHSRVQARLLAATLRLRRVEDLLQTDPAAAPRFLEEVRADLDRIREQDVREVSHLLHPAVISIGLVPALRRLGMDLRGAAEVVVDISPELERADDVGEGRIPEPVRLAIYRTVEESTTNALKHGDATAIAVTADVTDGTIVVTTTDNGCGFDPDLATKGLGLSSAASRLERLGGTYEILSAPGAGTTVVARVPMDGGQDDRTGATPTDRSSATGV